MAPNFVGVAASESSNKRARIPGSLRAYHSDRAGYTAYLPPSSSMCAIIPETPIPIIDGTCFRTLEVVSNTRRLIMASRTARLKLRSVSLALLFTVLVSAISYASAVSADGASHGIASFYTTYLPTACYESEESQFPTNGHFAAASDVFFGGGAACGDFYWVWCLSSCTSTNPILVRIVDRCPTGCASTIDLSTKAFAALADLDTGLIKIAYKKLDLPPSAQELAGTP